MIGSTGMYSRDEKIKLARTAAGEELWNCIRESGADILMNAAYNRNLTEEMAVCITKRKNVPSGILGMLAEDVRFKTSYKLKLAICKNPKTPLKAILQLLKFLRMFDLGDITKDQNVPICVRQKIEYHLLSQAVSLPSGVKMALAKRLSVTVILALMGKGDKNVVRSCLESVLLTEELLCKLINKPGTGPVVIKMISKDAKWSLRYRIRYSLTRNYHTPMEQAIGYISELKTDDLKELYHDKSLPLSTRPYIYHELTYRSEPVERPRLKRYNLLGDEDADFTEADLLK